MKVLLTNWVNLLGVFIPTFLYTIINSCFNYSATLGQALFGAFLLICLYGIMLWGGFLLSLILLDSVLIIPSTQYLRIKLIVEWVIISSPILYWTIKYERQRTLFLIAVISFLITQMIRRNLIVKVTH